MNFRSFALVGLALQITALASGPFALAQKTPSASATPVATPAATFPAPASEAPALNDKDNDYTVRTDIRPCAGSAEPCSFDTIVTATARDNGSIVWERQIFTVTYDVAAKEKHKITIKTAKFVGKKLLRVTNSKGDNFDLELTHGHLKSPKKPRDYSKKK